MSASNAKSAVSTAKATAPKATPAPMAPLFSMGPWPAKAQGGNSIRAYCYNVAKALAKARPANARLADGRTRSRMRMAPRAATLIPQRRAA